MLWTPLNVRDFLSKEMHFPCQKERVEEIGGGFVFEASQTGMLGIAFCQTPWIMQEKPRISPTVTEDIVASE